MRVGPQRRLTVIIDIAKGLPQARALEGAGYSELTATHKAGLILSGRAYMKTVKQYAQTIAAEIGESPIASELTLVQKSSKWTSELALATRRIQETYNEMRPDDVGASGPENSNGTQVPAVPTPKKRQRKFDTLMQKHHPNLADRIVRESQSPNFQQKVDQLLKRGRSLDGEHLSHLGMALLERDLVHPPKDARARGALARTALEAGGKIGAAAVELHLHQNSHVLPPVVRAMLESKMAELAGLQNRPELPAVVIDMPPDPLPGQTFRAECEPSAEDEAAQELLDRKAGSVQSSLAKIAETARLGGQVVAEENKRKLMEEMSRR